MEANHQTLVALGLELIDKGCRVFMPKSGLASFICITRGDQQCTYTFNEVPYRWTITANIQPSRKRGSSTLVKQTGLWDDDTYKSGFTADEILNNMRPMCQTPDKHIAGKLTFLEELK